MSGVRRSKRKSTVNIARATHAEIQQIREKRIGKLKRDAPQVVVVDDGDEDFEVRAFRWSVAHWTLSHFIMRAGIGLRK